MEEKVIAIISRALKANRILKYEVVQNLWSDYGALYRIYLEGGPVEIAILKHIKKITNAKNHPKGWNSSVSHYRKMKSYQIEKAWYDLYAEKYSQELNFPKLFTSQSWTDEFIFIIEDLNTKGFKERRSIDNISLLEAKNCLGWLAKFHATFLNHKDPKLWEKGSYWHLGTRKEELSNMKNTQLKEKAGAIQGKLDSCQFKTIIHGDAKLENFCFYADSDVSAVDFQYVGGGCGIIDVAYFISSCFRSDECYQCEGELLDHYFHILENETSEDVNFAALKSEWQSLYSWAWADFYRFLDGWSPGHWKMHSYSLDHTHKVLNLLEEGNHES